MLVHSLSVGNHKLQFCTRPGQTSSLDHLWTWVGLLISSQRGSFSPHFVLELNWYYLSGTVTKILNPNFVRSLSSYKICWEFIQDFTGITSLGGNKSNICPHIVQVQHMSRLCLRLELWVGWWQNQENKTLSRVCLGKRSDFTGTASLSKKIQALSTHGQRCKFVQT